jgi:hypothetical protein
MEFEFQCCFCGKAIEESPETSLDPCAIVVIGNWKRSSEEQVEQQYFCHLQCFKIAVEQHAPVDLEDLAADFV